jgi:3-hydroxybutyryl-CoA dehydrogenase
MSREFTKVGVVGLGTMGAGIAEVFARNGLPVVAIERDEAAIVRGLGHIEHSTARAVARGKLTAAQQRAILERIDCETDLGALADVDLVVEAVPEHLDLKRAIFARMDEVCKPDTILATNTSSLSVTEIAVATHRPGKVIGLHFFNPAPVMKLVEIIRSVVTEHDVVDDVEAFAQKLGKVDVTVGDRAGFIANALLFGYLNHAAEMYESHYATREDIDVGMTLGCGLPMGPLALIDLIGLDTSYEILDTMYEQTRNRLHAPTPILKQMITAGLLGRKAGRGFYTYDAPDSPTVVEDATVPGRVPAATPRRVERVGVVGSGVMATGIVEVLARGGYDVTFVARSSGKAERVQAAVARSMEKAVQRGKLDATARDAAIRRITSSTTSSLPVIQCAAATSRPGDVIGMHFFNPAAIMRLVEIVSTVSTTPDTEATALEVASVIGKRAVRCADRAGFIVNALLFPYLNDAVKMLEAHYATADDIDSAMKVGCGYPMGPFELIDVVGTDVALAIERTLYQEFHEPGFAPAPLLEHLVTAGRLGRKTGMGFRDYS